jgi:hypothetical protein
VTRRSRGADEADAFTRWRHVLSWPRGELRRIKTRANRRERRAARPEVRDQLAADRDDGREIEPW